MVGRIRHSESEDLEIQQMDKMQIIVVNVGDLDYRGDNEFIRMVNTLFSSELSKEQRRQIMGDSFNIKLGDITLRSLEGIGMSLGEEIRDYQREIGWNERDALAKQERLEDLSNVVAILCQRLGLTAEESADFLVVSDDVKEQVIIEAEKKLKDIN